MGGLKGKNKVGKPVVSLDTEKKLIVGVFPDGVTHSLKYDVVIKESKGK